MLLAWFAHEVRCLVQVSLLLSKNEPILRVELEKDDTIERRYVPCTYTHTWKDKHAPTYTYMYACEETRTHKRTSINIDTFTYTHIFVHEYRYTNVHAYVRQTHAHRHVYAHSHWYVHESFPRELNHLCRDIVRDWPVTGFLYFTKNCCQSRQSTIGQNTFHRTLFCLSSLWRAGRTQW